MHKKSYFVSAITSLALILVTFAWMVFDDTRTPDASTGEQESSTSATASREDSKRLDSGLLPADDVSISAGIRAPLEKTPTALKPDQAQADAPPSANERTAHTLTDLLHIATEADATPEQKRRAANLNVFCGFAPLSQQEIEALPEPQRWSEAFVATWHQELCDIGENLIDPEVARDWWRLSQDSADERQLIAIKRQLEQVNERETQRTIELLNALEQLIYTSTNPTVIRKGAELRIQHSPAWQLGVNLLSGTVWWMLARNRDSYQFIWAELLACEYAGDCGSVGARTLLLCRDHAVCRSGQTLESVLRAIQAPFLVNVARAHVDRWIDERGF